MYDIRLDFGSYSLKLPSKSAPMDRITKVRAPGEGQFEHLVEDLGA
jgi:hypothetical protein